MSAQIFLCYAKEDKLRVEKIYLALRRAGFRPWMDKPPKPYELDGIKPGQQWVAAITDNISISTCFLAILSKISVSKKGYVQKEYRLALEQMARMPAGDIFLVPVLLESDCPLPSLSVASIEFRDLQWFDLESDGLRTLLRFLKEEITPNRVAKSYRDNAVIPIHSITEFYTTIGSKRTMKLDPAAYLLTPDMAEFQYNDNVHVRKVFDGWQFNIRNVDNLKIEGESRAATQLLVNSRYSFVLSFYRCSNVDLTNLSLAHSPPGYCAGGVVKLENCSNVSISHCSMHGSGTVGLDISQVDGLSVTNSSISHCTYGIMNIRNLTDGKFEEVEFRDNRQYWGIEIVDSKNLSFCKCDLTDNDAGEHPLLAVHPDSEVTWDGGRIFRNKAKSLCYFSRNIRFSATEIKYNKFDASEGA